MSERAEAEACQEPELNKAVTDAIQGLLDPMPNPVTHGQFNRRMFLEAVVVKGGAGASIDKDDIIKHSGMTDKEFVIIKEEYIAKGIIKEGTNLFGVTLYGLQYNTNEG
jgi:hypothetical protein